MSARCARCASCSYPLTISDSVTCHECMSHFHIDCAQLFGFPYYELSRNTFHCSTCKLLPLPGRQSDDDSDSERECAMPSRQLDYHIEGQPDFSVDMNEIKGSVQDLSDLCKDMLREINDIKSINLTLRCCVENLRHENEALDRVVEELKRRLDALERNSQRKQIEPFNRDMDGLRPDEEVERYMTPEPPECDAKEDDMEVSSPRNVTFHHSVYDYKTEDNETQDKLSEYILSQEKTKIDYDEKEPKFSVFSEDEKCKDIKSNTEIELEPTDINTLTNINQETEIEHTLKPCIEDRTTPEDLKETEEENIQDWTWKENKAITLDSAEEETEITDEGALDEEPEEEDVDAQEWELLNEEIQSETAVRRFDEDVNASATGDEWIAEREVEDLDAIEEEEGLEQKHERSKRHVEEEEFGSQEYDNYEKDEVDNLLKDYLEDENETEEETEMNTNKFYKEGKSEIDEKEVENIPEEGEKVEETPHVQEDGEKVPEETEGEISSEGAVLVEGEPHPEGEVPHEGEPQTDEGLHLEGERPIDEEGQPVAEGEQNTGGQSPEEGEVQPAEPPPPPEPEHTEEDLWHYLKEAVTSVHPSTVEEFVQNLIGTLQHVPDEYLRPVIDANIKRATSPSVTDGEHLPVESHLEGEESVPVEGSAPADTLPGEGGEIPSSADDHPAPIPDDTPAVEDESAVPTEELSSEVPEDRVLDEDCTDPNDGYSALEAAA